MTTIKTIDDLQTEIIKLPLENFSPKKVFEDIKEGEIINSNWIKDDVDLNLIEKLNVDSKAEVEYVEIVEDY